MSVTRVSVGINGGASLRTGAQPDVPITPVGTILPLKGAGRKATDLPQRAGRTREATLVMASPLAASRRRWIARLQGALAVCEVTERRALEQVMTLLKPDVLVVDLALTGLRRVRGLAHIQRLSPSTKIVALTDTPAEGEGVCALKAGARGYCPRTIDPEHLHKAVAAVRNGEIWAPRKLVPGLVAELRSLIDTHQQDHLQPMLDSRLDRLTARQRVVADLIGKGVCNKDIASQLNISERTVKAHLTEAFRNVGVSDRLQLALLLQGYPSGSG